MQEETVKISFSKENGVSVSTCVESADFKLYTVFFTVVDEPTFMVFS